MDNFDRKQLATQLEDVVRKKIKTAKEPLFKNPTNDEFSKYLSLWINYDKLAYTENSFLPGYFTAYFGGSGEIEFKKENSERYSNNYTFNPFMVRIKEDYHSEDDIEILDIITFQN